MVVEIPMWVVYTGTAGLILIFLGIPLFLIIRGKLRERRARWSRLTQGNANE